MSTSTINYYLLLPLIPTIAVGFAFFSMTLVLKINKHMKKSQYFSLMLIILIITYLSSLISIGLEYEIEKK